MQRLMKQVLDLKQQQSLIHSLFQQHLPALHKLWLVTQRQQLM
jgi:hypothetical protein